MSDDLMPLTQSQQYVSGGNDPVLGETSILDQNSATCNNSGFSRSTSQESTGMLIYSQETADHIFREYNELTNFFLRQNSDPLLNVCSSQEAPSEFTALMTKDESSVSAGLIPQEFNIQTETYIVKSTGSSPPLTNYPTCSYVTDFNDGFRTCSNVSDANGGSVISQGQISSRLPSVSSVFSLLTNTGSSTSFSTATSGFSLDYSKSGFTGSGSGPPNFHGVFQNYESQATMEPFLHNAFNPPIISPAPPIIKDFPSNSPYPGNYGFEIFIPESRENASKKSIAYTYSVDQNKLYARINAVCPISVKLSRDPPPNCRIRAMVIYAKHEDAAEVVTRCANHASKDKGSPTALHLARCTNSVAVYYEDPVNKRHSVIVPYEHPSIGSDSFTVYYYFTCFSSCVGAINRRPTQLILTLEQNERVIGRQVLELRICACPGRDRHLDEEQLTNHGAAKRKHKTGTACTTITSVEPYPKMVKQADDDSEVYTVQVRGRHLYKLVTSIVKNYEVAQSVAAYRAFCQRSMNNSDHHSSLTIGGAASTKSTDKFSPELKIDSNTPILEWLEKLDMVQHARKFQDNGISRMAQLETISEESVRKLGMPAADFDKIYAALLRWRMMNAAVVSSQLSSVDPTTPAALNTSNLSLGQQNSTQNQQKLVKIEQQSSQASQQAQSQASQQAYHQQQQFHQPQGLQISRTTVKHSYKIKGLTVTPSRGQGTNGSI